MSRNGRPRVVRMSEAVREYLQTESAGGIVLFAAAAAAMLWANLFEASYHDVWGAELRLGVGSLAKTLDLQHWVNDALMVIFFLVVGLEIKRELVVGELSDRKTAIVPVVAALGGMVGPAAFYLAFNAGEPSLRGWGIPMATDIAFALGVLAIFGRRVRPGVKVFLLTLAIVDDIGAIGVIAVAYTDDLSIVGLAVAFAGLGGVVLLRNMGVRTPFAYVVPGLVVWGGTLASGVHPTIAGVTLGLVTPARPFRGRDILDEVQDKLHPISSFVVIPLFALANAGISVDAGAIGDAARSPILHGVVSGLVGGKILGILLATLLVLWLAKARLPSLMTVRDVIVVGILGGIGFTVAIFISELAFDAAASVDVAKTGVLFASLICAVAASVMLSIATRRSRVGETIDSETEV